MQQAGFVSAKARIQIQFWFKEKKKKTCTKKNTNQLSTLIRKECYISPHLHPEFLLKKNYWWWRLEKFWI